MKELGEVAYEAYKNSLTTNDKLHNAHYYERPYADASELQQLAWQAAAIAAIQEFQNGASIAKKPTLEELVWRYSEHSISMEDSMAYMLTALEPWLGPGFFDQPNTPDSPVPCPAPESSCTSVPAQGAPAQPPRPESCEQSQADPEETSMSVCREKLLAGALDSLRTYEALLSSLGFSGSHKQIQTQKDLLGRVCQIIEIYQEALADLARADLNRREPDRKQ